MKNTAIIISILLLAIPNYSQVNEHEEQKNKDYLKLYFLNGYGVIYQFDETKTSSFRLHLDVSTDGFNHEDEHSSSHFDTDTSTYNSSGEINTNSLSFQLSPQYYVSLISKEYFILYAGGGPLLSFGFANESSKDEWKSSNSNHKSNSYSEIHTKRYELGMIIFIGVESRINDNFGIFSEIDLRGGKNWQHENRNSEVRHSPNSVITSSGESSRSEWFYNLSRVRLGIYILL